MMCIEQTMMCYKYRKRSFTEDLLVIWVHKRVIHIISTISNLLPLVNSGSFIASLAQTCDYCGQSLGHVGMDFRGLLPPIFEKRVISLFEHNCNTSILQFQSALTNHDWFVTVELLSTMGVDNKQKEDGDTENDANHAPQILLQYPPLAVLTNGFIKAFNELREFVTYSTMNDCKTILINAIKSTVDCIRKFSVSSHHYHSTATNNLQRNSLNLRRRRSSNKRKKKKKQQKQNKKVNANSPDSVKDERRRSMANVPTALESDMQTIEDDTDMKEEKIVCCC